jgi:hypothetical protein
LLDMLLLPALPPVSGGRSTQQARALLSGVLGRLKR